MYFLSPIVIGVLAAFGYGAYLMRDQMEAVEFAIVLGAVPVLIIWGVKGIRVWQSLKRCKSGAVYHA